MMRKVRVVKYGQKPAMGSPGKSRGFNSGQFPVYYPGTEWVKPPTEVRSSLGPVEPEDATIEAEGGESVYIPDQGGLPAHYDIKGPRHSQGGTPLNVPPDSFVYSDTNNMKLKGDILKYFGKSPDTKKRYTPADLAKQYDINKFRKILQDPDTDPIAKHSAELMIANYNKKLGALALAQEANKGFPTGIPVAAMPYLLSFAVSPDDVLPLKSPEDLEQMGMGDVDNDQELGESKYGGTWADPNYYSFGGSYSAQTEPEYGGAWMGKALAKKGDGGPPDPFTGLEQSEQELAALVEKRNLEAKKHEQEKGTMRINQTINYKTARLNEEKKDLLTKMHQKWDIVQGKPGATPADTRNNTPEARLALAQSLAEDRRKLNLLNATLKISGDPENYKYNPGIFNALNPVEYHPEWWNQHQTKPVAPVKPVAPTSPQDTVVVPGLEGQMGFAYGGSYQAGGGVKSIQRDPVTGSTYTTYGDGSISKTTQDGKVTWKGEKLPSVSMDEKVATAGMKNTPSTKKTTSSSSTIPYDQSQLPDLIQNILKEAGVKVDPSVLDTGVIGKQKWDPSKKAWVDEKTGVSVPYESFVKNNEWYFQKRKAEGLGEYDPSNKKDVAHFEKSFNQYNEDTAYDQLVKRGIDPDKARQAAKLLVNYTGFTNKAGALQNADQTQGNYHNSRIPLSFVDEAAQAPTINAGTPAGAIQKNPTPRWKRASTYAPWYLQDKVKTWGAAGDFLRLKKYLPWAPKIEPTVPETTFYDPTRELAQNAEQMNIGTQGAAMFAGAQGYNSRASQIQGKGSENAANILSRYNNLNVGVANQASAMKADTYNKTNAFNAEMAQKLHEGVTIANQQFDNAKAEARGELRQSYIDAITNRSAAQALNATSKHFITDPASGGFVRYAKNTPFEPGSNQGDVESLNAFVDSQRGRMTPDKAADVWLRLSGYNSPKSQEQEYQRDQGYRSR